jgi:hypothetical protein
MDCTRVHQIRSVALCYVVESVLVEEKHPLRLYAGDDVERGLMVMRGARPRIQGHLWMATCGIRQNDAELALRVGNEREGTDKRDFGYRCGDKKGGEQLAEGGEGAVSDGQYDGEVRGGGVAGRGRGEPEETEDEDEQPAGQARHGC